MRRPARWRRGVLVALLLVLRTALAADQGYSFEASEFAKKPYEFGGYLEADPQYFWLNPGSAGYNLNYPNGAPSSVHGVTGILELYGKYAVDIASVRFRTHSDVERYNTVDDNSNKLYEGVFSLRPNPGLTLEVGKQALQWGKGYAQTFVGFVQRPKDPDDPALAREGYTIANADLIRNFDGPLQTVAFTPVVLPVNSDVNSDYGNLGHTNFAAKLYFLYRDTDIDFMYLTNGSRPARFGMDFSRNLATNFEIHGEWAHIWNQQTPVLGSSGQVTMQTGSPTNYMAGLRYLTERDTTFIVEYYHNGSGYSEEQIAEIAYNQKWIANAPLIVVLCMVGVGDDRDGRNIQKQRFPEYAVQIDEMEQRLYRALNQEEHQTKIAGTHIALAALEHGVHSCWVSRFEVMKVAELLHLPENCLPSEILVFGYPEKQRKSAKKKLLKDLVFYNSFTTQST